MTDPPSRAGNEHQRSDVVVVLQQCAAQLLLALAEGHTSAAKASTLLELITRVATSSSAGLQADEASQLCASCCGALADSSPEVAARASLALGATLLLCQECSGVQDPSQQLQLASVAQQAVAAMQRHSAEPAVAAAGLHLLLRLSGSSSHTSSEQQDMLGAAGAVPAAVAALALLSTSFGSSVESGAAGAGGSQQQQLQQRSQAIAEGLQALHHMCSGHAGNLLATAGGMQAVSAAMAAAASHWPAEEQGLFLLAQLACREGASQQEVQAAAVAIWQAAQAQVESRLVEVSRAAVWAMSRVLQCLLQSAPSSPLVPELLLQGTAVVLAMLQSCDKKDDPLLKHCCDFLSIASGATAQQPAVCAALLSREAAAALLLVAGQAQEARTQATALRTLYHLCQAGGCGLTWQQLATGGDLSDPSTSQIVAGCCSIAAATFAVVSSAAAGKQSARQPRDVLAVQLFGLAAVGALLASAESRDPWAAAELAGQLAREQLEAAQEAVALACGTLGSSQELLALLEAQPVGDEELGAGQAAAEPTTFLLDSPRLGCHEATWEEPLTWRPAADAVRGVVSLLRHSAPDGVNTPDRDGCTLLHRLALAGHARCLQLLLLLATPHDHQQHEEEEGCASTAINASSASSPSPPLDLLVRTRAGANAFQLARQLRHDACATLLEGATQQAAEARQAELLRELEEMEAEEVAAAAGNGGKKGGGSKKKKAVSRSTSFGADQPEGKTQRLNGSSESGEECEEMAPPGLDSGAAAAEAAQLQQLQQLAERLQAQREREEAYEQALAARRRELAELSAAQQAQHALSAADTPVAGPALTVHVTPGGMPAGSSAELAADSMPEGLPAAEAVEAELSQAYSSGGSDQPGTPEQMDDQPATPNAAAASTPAANGDAGASRNTSSGGSNSPEPQLPGEGRAEVDMAAAGQEGTGTFAGGSHFAGGLMGMPLSAQAAGLTSLGLLQQQQQSALSVLATSLGHSNSGAGLFAETPAPPGQSLERTSSGGGSLFGSPAMVGSMLFESVPSPYSAGVGASLASSMAGSPFMQSLAAVSPPTSRPLAGRSAYASPPGSAAPYPSPAANPNLLSTPQQHSARQGGLPPLPSGRQPSYSSSALTTSAGTAGAAANLDTDRLLSLHLQDALFVGSPTSAPASGLSHMSQQGQQQGSLEHRHPLFASLAVNHEEEDHCDSTHLLSNSLSCLDDGGSCGSGSGGSMGGGEALMARHLSSCSAGSGSISSASEALLASLRHQQAGSPGSGLGSPQGRLMMQHAQQACGGGDSNSDESSEPTRHLWIGNLGTRTPRSVLKSIFERFGVVDDVVTFPGRMYAFVNYRTTEEAVTAFATLQDAVVAELTGDRRLLIKYRPAKKAAIHLRALGLVDEDGSPTDDSYCRLDLDRDGNSSEPSPRIWLGNIAPTATSKSLHAVLGRFGVLTDAAVFPARIGPLGYAFVKFEQVQDATRAFEALNNTVVPTLSGSKQLKMRYKPANDGPVGRGEDPSDPCKTVMVPSRHLWLGNITQKPTDEHVLEVFASFGKVDSVRVFPVKAYAFVNYADIGSAIKAMQAVDGLAIPQLTGVKPLVMRYQQESGGSTSSTPKPPGSASSGCLLPRVASDAAMSALGLNQMVPGPGLVVSFLAGANTAPATLAGTTAGTSADGSGSDDGLCPVPNLSNKLNPNNLHYDSELAERYKHMNRREKDLMWAADSLLHPADPAKGMLRSHSMGYLAGASGTSAAATAQAHAAMAVLLQQQQAQQAQQAGLLGGVGTHGLSPSASNSLLTTQLLALHQLTPSSPAPPAQASQVPTGASASQLTAVLNNLTAMRRTGSLPSPAGGSAGLQLHHAAAHGMPLPQQAAAGHLSSASMLGSGMAPGLTQAHSMPLPQQAQQAAQQEYLQQLLLAQQAAQQAQQAAQQAQHGRPPLSPMDSYGSGGLSAQQAQHSPSQQQINRLSSLLANQSLGGSHASNGSYHASSSSTGSSHRGTTPMHSMGGTPSVLSPQAAPGLVTPHHAQSLASALSQLAASQGGHRAPSPGGTHMLHHLSPINHHAHGRSQAHSHGHSHGHGHSLGHPHAHVHALASGVPSGSLPQQFYCPLTRQVMTDPVLAADGVTYERQAISEWMAYKDVSPATHLPLPHKMLTPNTVLRAGLIDMLRQHC